MADEIKGIGEIVKKANPGEIHEGITHADAEA